MEAPWTPAPPAPGSIPAARAARAAARAKASNGWGGSLPSGEGGDGAHCCRWPGPFLPFAYAVIHLCSVVARQGVVKRIKSGRGPSPQSGGAGGRKHCYRPGSNQRSMRRLPTMVTTTPLCLPCTLPSNMAYPQDSSLALYLMRSGPPPTWGIGRVPMQNFLLLAELGALGMCPCRLYYYWQK